MHATPQHPTTVSASLLQEARSNPFFFPSPDHYLSFGQRTHRTRLARQVKQQPDASCLLETVRPFSSVWPLRVETRADRKAFGSSLAGCRVGRTNSPCQSYASLSVPASLLRVLTTCLSVFCSIKGERVTTTEATSATRTERLPSSRLVSSSGSVRCLPCSSTAPSQGEFESVPRLTLTGCRFAVGAILVGLGVGWVVRYSRKA